MINKKYYAVILLVLLVLQLASCDKGLTDSEYYEKALQYKHENRLFASVIELKNALKQKPDNAQYRFLLGKIYLDLDDGASAEKELRKAYESSGDKEKITLFIAVALNQQNKYQEALGELAKGKPNDVALAAEYEAVRAMAYLGQKNLGGAEKEIMQAVSSAPGDLRVQLTNIRILLAQGKSDAAKDALADTLNAYPNSAEAWLLNGRLAETIHNEKLAKHAYQRVLDIEPKSRLTQKTSFARMALAFLALRENDISSAKQQADVLYHANKEHFLSNYLLGLIAFREKNYKQALDYLRVSYSKNDEFAPTGLLLGSVSYALGQYNQAESYLTRYTGRFPDSLEARRLLGATYMHLGDASRALEVLGGVLEKNPKDPQLLSTVGELAIRTGKFALGEQYIKKSITLGGSEDKGHLQLANAYMYSGRYEDAIKVLEGLAATPGGDDFVNTKTLIQAYLRNRQPEQGLAAANKYAQRHPEESRAYLMRGAVYVALNDMNKAKHEFETAIQKDVNNLSAYLDIARIELVQNQYDQARANLQSVLAKNDKNIIAMMLMAQVEEREGKQAKAIEWLENARNSDANAIAPRLLLANYYYKTNKPKSAQVYIDEILDLQPKNNLALGLKVDIYLRQDELAKAYVAAQDWITAQPEQPAAYFKLGLVQEKQKKLSEANASFNQAVKLNPLFYPALQAIAKLDIMSGKPDKALKLAKSVQQLHPKSSVGYMLEGDVKMALKQPEGAYQAYSMANQYEQNSTIVIKLARALMAAGKPWRVLSKPLADWLKQHPNDIRVLLQLGVMSSAKGQDETTISSYQKILEHEPNNAAILNDLAYILYENKKDPKALELAKRGYELSPNLPAFQDTYGWILLQEGQHEKGMKLLERAHAKLPGQPDISYHYGYALYKSGNQAKAKDVIKQLLKEHKQFNSRQLAEKLYSKLK